MGLTESEFQEFIITLGYRYNEKSKTSFNTFEGFHNVIIFGENEGRYSLRLECVSKGAEESATVQRAIRRFHEDHKDYVIRTAVKRRFIEIEIKMTIDSDIDKEELRQLVHFMTEMFKSGIIKPLCAICSRERKTGLYVVGTKLTPMCDKCLARKLRQYEIRKNKFITKKQNMTLGLIGAVFGAALGASVYILLYQLMPTFCMGGVMVIIPSFIGFVVTGRRATVKSAVICAVLSWLIYILAEYTAIIANMAILIEQAGGGIAVSEAVDVINASLADTTYLMPIVNNIIFSSLFMALIGMIYFLKRNFTRPFKISQNIL